MSNVDNKHPDYGRRVLEWLQMRHVEEGATAVKDQGVTYLPMPGGFRAQEDEGLGMYSAYKMRAEFPDIVTPTLQGMVGLIHKGEPQIEMPDSMLPIWENATPDGLTLEALYRKITTEVMLMGRFALLPEASSGGSDVPWIALYNAESVINWSSDRTFFVLDESGLVRDGFDWRQQNKYRVLRLSNGIYVQEVYGEDKELSREITPKRRSGSGLTEIPFVIVGPTDLSVDPSLPPLLGVARSAIAAYRLDADYRHQLFMSGQETLVFIGIENSDQLPKFVGAGVIHGLPPASDAKYVGPSGTGIAAHRTAILDERANAVNAGARLFDQTSGPDRESGKAKGMRYSAETATLASVSINSAAGLEKALRYVAIMMGEDAQSVIVKPNLEFFDAKLTAQEVINLVKGWQDGGYSYQTLYENLQRGGIASPERDYKEEHSAVKLEQDERTRKAEEEAARIAKTANPTHNPTAPRAVA